MDWASQERGGGTADRANQKEFEEAKVSILKWQIWTIATVKILKRDEALQRFTHKFTDTHCHLDRIFDIAREPYGDVDKYFTKVLQYRVPPTYQGIFALFFPSI